jgi:DNA-binding MarR family transcriptional regulator
MTTAQEIVANCACLKVRMAARAVTRAYDTALRPVGLRATQLSILVAIAIDGAISIAALASFLGTDRTTLTRNLRPLENEGLVSVGPEGWRRSRTLEITKKGQWRLREALPLWERAQDALRQKLGDQAWVDVRHSLDRLIRAARNTSPEEALLQRSATTRPQIADKKMP